MSINEITQKISQGGRNGVRRTEVKKDFQNAPIEEEIESLIRNGDIVMDKKGTAYYLWETNNYLEYLLMTDTKFRLLYNKIEETKVLVGKNIKQDLVTADTDIAKNCYNDTFVTSESHTSSSDIVCQVATLDKDTFRQEFDFALRKYSSSSGWVPLTSIREEMERQYNLGREEFYSQVEEITNKEYDTYELSSGGIEGITIRGILHGFVRCI